MNPFSSAQLRPTALACLILFHLVPGGLQAQDDDRPKTLFGNRGPIHHGGWGAPTAHYTSIMDQDALLLGVRGGWLINHRFTLGLATHGLVTKVHHPEYDRHLRDGGQDLQDRSRFHAGYGGLLLEPIISYRSPVHVSLPIIIGAGGCGYEYNGPPPPTFDPLTDNAGGQAFFVFEPGVDVEFNLLALLRLAVGVSYRYTSALDLRDTPWDALHGFNAGFSFKVGRF